MSDEHQRVEGGFVCRSCMATFETPLGMARHRDRCRRRMEGER